MKTIKFYTLGCKVNQYDTQCIKERFLSQGFKECADLNEAGICLINTCSVTSSADQKSRSLIRQCIKGNPLARIIVTGCLVRKDYLSLSEIPVIDLIVSRAFFPEGISSFSGRTRAFLKIQEGCNNFCVYCKVPLIRGRSRSKPLERIIAEAQELAKNGFKEIVLSGICLGSYGRDLSPRANLVEAIEVIEKIDGLWRIRLSSIEARDISRELIAKIASSQKLCWHLHIPLQSGDDRVLKDMHRGYSREDYLSLIKRIRDEIPDIAITTDCLIGFPTENESRFQNTLEAIRKILPLKVHIFPYSRREGTAAARDFHHQLKPGVVKERFYRLKKEAAFLSLAYQRRFLDRDLAVLIEARPKDDSCFWEGHSSNYLKVRVKSKKNLNNQLIPVRLRKIYKDYILGVIS
jgi:threonylcarbamoyladenosine tRNA methylthiotransferase MtaB